MRGRIEVHSLRQRLNAAFARAPHPSTDPQLQADFAKYLCVLVSGFLEKAIASLLIARAEDKASPDVASFVEFSLGRWQNPNSERLLQLLGSFDTEWRRALEANLADEVRAAIDSVIALRNQIAHGANVGTTLSQIKSYYAHILKVVDQVADLVDPNGGGSA
jgi:RiboL-PSP-HEPN